MMLPSFYPTTPMVLFSGGLDSTALLFGLLQKYKRVRVTTGMNMEHPQVQSEAMARNSILFHLREPEFRTKYNLGIVEESPRPYPVPGFKAGLLSMVQPVDWLTVALHDLRADTSCVNIGYVADDEPAELIANMRELWEAIIKTSTTKDTFQQFKGAPTLEFPLATVEKKRIISELPAELLNNVVWCERGGNCEECASCVLMNTVAKSMSGTWPEAKSPFFLRALSA